MVRLSAGNSTTQTRQQQQTEEADAGLNKLLKPKTPKQWNSGINFFFSFSSLEQLTLVQCAKEESFLRQLQSCGQCLNSEWTTTVILTHFSTGFLVALQECPLFSFFLSFIISFFSPPPGQRKWNIMVDRIATIWIEKFPNKWKCSWIFHSQSPSCSGGGLLFCFVHVTSPGSNLWHTVNACTCVHWAQCFPSHLVLRQCGNLFTFSDYGVSSVPLNAILYAVLTTQFRCTTKCSQAQNVPQE